MLVYDNILLDVFCGYSSMPKRTLKCENLELNEFLRNKLNTFAVILSNLMAETLLDSNLT